MQAKFRTIIALVALILFISSCNRAITPYEAANGKAKCGRAIR
jgi:PBP1b-binding outer membrane lipoprotein LpoB